MSHEIKWLLRIGIIMCSSITQFILLHRSIILTQDEVTTTSTMTMVKMHSLEEDPTFLEEEEENNIHVVSRNNAQKPLLVLHVGPLKTGSTSVQLNVIRNKEFKPFLTQDHYQEIVGFDYRHFKPLFQTCFKEESSQDCTLLSTLQTLYQQAYNHTQSQNFTLHTIHTSEDFSSMPRNNITFHTMKQIFDKWNVHIIMFYRPLHHWLTSMYAQYRKYYIARPKDADQPFEQKYLIVPGEQLEFPLYFRMLKESTYYIRDTIGTFRYFQELLSYCDSEGKSTTITNSSATFSSTARKIQVLPMYRKDTNHNSTAGIEHEFICHLPHATNSCQYITNKRGGYKGRQRNTSFHLPLDLDLIVVQAYHERLISVPRHDAALALEKQFKYANISISRDLPMVCITQEEQEWIWNYMMEGHEYLMQHTDSNTFHLDPINRFEFDSYQTNFCSVNATAALELPYVRKLFDTCDLHSPRFLNRMLTFEDVDPKWDELGCSSLVKNNTSVNI